MLNPARRINLRTLTNGVLDELGRTTLPAGTYTQLRLVLADNDASGQLENSIQFASGGPEVALDTPSAKQSGLKMNVNIAVQPDTVADIVLDFGACKSIVRRGNSGQYNLKPVVAVIPVLSSVNQRVVGYVDPSIASDSTVISVQSNGTIARATPPMTSGEVGKFVLFPVPVGSYDLVVAADGRATAVMTGVPVTTTAVTFANSASAPIAPPPSAMRASAGTLSKGNSFDDTGGEVAAMQSLDATLQVEVAAQAVDAMTGSFAFSLPAAAPQRAAYAASGVPSFSAAASAAGKYRLVASIFGVAPMTADIDVSAVDAAPVPFAFP